jgi:hypothetical protein
VNHFEIIRETEANLVFARGKTPFGTASVGISPLIISTPAITTTMDMETNGHRRPNHYLLRRRRSAGDRDPHLSASAFLPRATASWPRSTTTSYPCSVCPTPPANRLLASASPRSHRGPTVGCSPARQPAQPRRQ